MSCVGWTEGYLTLYLAGQLTISGFLDQANFELLNVLLIRNPRERLFRSLSVVEIAGSSIVCEKVHIQHSQKSSSQFATYSWKCYFSLFPCNRHGSDTLQHARMNNMQVPRLSILPCPTKSPSDSKKMCHLLLDRAFLVVRNCWVSCPRGSGQPLGAQTSAITILYVSG
jgi:hypothetical protein